MRILVLSDLHVDYPQNRAKVAGMAEAMASFDADAFVLAGDVGHKPSQVEEVLRAFSGLSCPKFFVAGNHDIWIVKPEREPFKDSWEKMAHLSELAAQSGFVPLDVRNGQAAGFTFVGSIGWYDYSFANPGLRLSPTEYARKQWVDLTYMDRDYARWGMPDEAVARRMESGVAQRLGQASAPLVFVSHHVPRQEWVLRRGHPSWDFFNAYMGTQALEQQLERAQVSRFIFGHTHRPVTLIEPHRFVINNPLGYPRQALTPIVKPFPVT